MTTTRASPHVSWTDVQDQRGIGSLPMSARALRTIVQRAVLCDLAKNQRVRGGLAAMRSSRPASVRSTWAAPGDTRRSNRMPLLLTREVGAFAGPRGGPSPALAPMPAALSSPSTGIARSTNTSWARFLVRQARWRNRSVEGKSAGGAGSTGRGPARNRGSAGVSSISRRVAAPDEQRR